jgi:hypothetical protein
MKYLVISHIKDAFYMLPPEKRAELQSSVYSFGDKYKKSGKELESYYLADLKDTVTIWDLASAEEGACISMENPAIPSIENKFIPLIEHDVAEKVMAEMAGKAKKSAKK